MPTPFPAPMGEMLNAFFDVPDVDVRSVEVRGRLLGRHDPTREAYRGVDLDVAAVTDDDARALANRWGLTPLRPLLGPAPTWSTRDYVHRYWRGTVETSAGSVAVQVRTCLPAPTVEPAPDPPRRRSRRKAVLS